jgi:hypothetical protein
MMARETAGGCDEEVERAVRIAQSHPLLKPSRLERWLRYKQSKLEILEKMANVKGVVFFCQQKSTAGERNGCMIALTRISLWEEEESDWLEEDGLP